MEELSLVHIVDVGPFQVMESTSLNLTDARFFRMKGTNLLEVGVVPCSEAKKTSFV